MKTPKPELFGAQRARRREIRFVQEIKCFGAELDIAALAVQRELLVQPEIEVIERRVADDVSRRVSERLRVTGKAEGGRVQIGSARTAG